MPNPTNPLPYAQGVLAAFLHTKKLEGEIIPEMQVEAEVTEVKDSHAFISVKYYNDFHYDENWIDGCLESRWREYHEAETTDFFPTDDMDEAYQRISAVIDEINAEYLANTKNK